MTTLAKKIVVGSAEHLQELKKMAIIGQIADKLAELFSMDPELNNADTYEFIQALTQMKLNK